MSVGDQKIREVAEFKFTKLCVRGSEFGIFVRAKFQRGGHRRPTYAATLPRPVYESSFWTSEEVYGPSRDHTDSSLLSSA